MRCNTSALGLYLLPLRIEPHLLDAFPCSRRPGLGLVHDMVFFVHLFGLLEGAVSGSLHLHYFNARGCGEFDKRVGASREAEKGADVPDRCCDGSLQARLHA